MARHFIYPHPNPDGTNSDRRIELQWQRDTYVLIGTSAWKGAPGIPDTSVDFLPVPAGVAPNTAPAPAWDGEFVDLTRDQINHLIKQLRVARDQVFGRDE